MARQLLALFSLVAGVSMMTACGAETTGTAAGTKADAAQSAPSRPSPADKLVRNAEAAIDGKPDAARGYVMLCAAYMQKARETGDFGLNGRARAALDKAFAIEPNSYDALRQRAALELVYHDFDKALASAQEAVQSHSSDHDAWGAMTDALVELGRYDEAVDAAQRMVDLRPETSSLARVAYLRELHGDLDGSVEAMRAAAEASSPADPEGAAWTRVHLGDALMKVGKREDAEREYDRALYLFPDYHVALAAKARARVAAGDPGAAVDLYRRAIERVPLPDTAAALGDLYTRLGQADEAKRQYALVEAIEKASGSDGVYSRQLALFWSDHDERLPEALAVARAERAKRNDVFTCDVLAWCLYKTGDLEGARAASTEARRLGTRDARILYHAGLIARDSGDRAEASKLLKAALAADPTFDPLSADGARTALASLGVKGNKA